MFISNIFESILPSYVKDILKEWKFTIESTYSIKKWEKAGRPLPPPSFFKNQVIRELRDKYNLNIFIETGTFLGNTTEIQRRKFNRIFSIELSEELFKRAKKRFHKYNSVNIMQGDSAVLLPIVLKEINNSALFWLDAHYSGILSGEITAKASKDCPIYEELDAIFAHKETHVVLIDDAREFVGQNSYPTIAALETLDKPF